jgi:hypothetical protein
MKKHDQRNEPHDSNDSNGSDDADDADDEPRGSEPGEKGGGRASERGAGPPAPSVGLGRLVLITAIVVAVATAVVLAVLVSVVERKQEAKTPTFRVVELTDDTEDPAEWGKNYPLQYDSYKRTADMVHTRYGGSEAEPRTAHHERPAHQGVAVEDRRGPAPQGHLGRLRLRGRLP